MLVLSRQRDQAIMIGDDIEVSVVDLRGDKVRLGINAPRSVSVHRKEIYEAIRRENKAAAELRPEDVASVVPPTQNGNTHMKLVKDDPSNGDPFLRAAIDEARKSLSQGGMPVGAVLVRDGRIIGRGHDRRIQRGDPLAHAELDCLTNAGRQKCYSDTTLYTTLMPGLSATGAILQLGIPRLCVADAVNSNGGECKAAKGSQLLRDCGVEITDLRDQESIDIMTMFAKQHPGEFK
jgi:cytosine deaminase